VGLSCLKGAETVDPLRRRDVILMDESTENIVSLDPSWSLNEETYWRSRNG